MIANLSPISNFVEENLSTLQYASKASTISNQPKINQDPRAVMIMEQKDQISKLKKQLQQANEQIKFLANGELPRCTHCEEYLDEIQRLKELLSEKTKIGEVINNFNGNQIKIYNGGLGSPIRDERGTSLTQRQSEIRSFTKQTGKLKQQLEEELTKKQEMLKLKATNATEDMNKLLHRTNFNMNKAILDEIQHENTEASPDRKPSAQLNQYSMQIHSSDLQTTSSDRLIQSISMIKEILLSNMQLREEQFRLAEEHDLTI